jgi:hypothetical protein
VQFNRVNAVIAFTGHLKFPVMKSAPGKQESLLKKVAPPEPEK